MRHHVDHEAEPATFTVELVFLRDDTVKRNRGIPLESDHAGRWV
jgi:hypothetical protein